MRRFLIGAAAVLLVSPACAQNIQLPGLGGQAGAQLPGNLPKAGVQAGAGASIQAPMTFQGQAKSNAHRYLTAPQMAIDESMGTVAGARNNDWRYRNIDGRWWYYQPNNSWVVWDNGQWLALGFYGHYRNNNGQYLTVDSSTGTRLYSGYRGVNDGQYYHGFSTGYYGYGGPGRWWRCWMNYH